MRKLQLAALITVTALAGTLVYAGCEACGSGPACSTNECKKIGGQKEAKINTPALAALINTKVPSIILDARSGKFDDGKRIPGAKSLNAGSSDDAIKAMLPDKSALIVTYCVNLKCQASHQLADKLKQMGYNNVIEYPEGIEGWLKAGHS